MCVIILLKEFSQRYPPCASRIALQISLLRRFFRSLHTRSQCLWINPHTQFELLIGGFHPCKTSDGLIVRRGDHRDSDGLHRLKLARDGRLAGDRRTRTRANAQHIERHFPGVNHHEIHARLMQTARIIRDGRLSARGLDDH